MVQRKPKALIKITILQNMPLNFVKRDSCYYIGNNIHSLNSKDIKLLNFYNISDLNLKQIEQFIVNLDSFFKDSIFQLLSICTANRYLSTVHDDVLKAYLILEILNKNQETIFVVDSYEEAHQWKKFFTSNSRDVLVLGDNAKYHIKKIVQNLLLFVKCIKNIVKEYFCIKLSNKKQNNYSNLNFITWVNNDTENFEKLLHSNSYFGRLPEEFIKKRNIGLLGHILNRNPDFAKILKINIPFIEEHINISDIIYAFFKNFSLIFYYNKRVSFKDYNFSSIIQNGIMKDFFGGFFIKNLLNYKAFKRFFKDLPDGATLIYPFENQPWERGLLKASKEQPKKINLWAYQFFPIPKDFLIYHFSEKVKAGGFIPTKILTSDSQTNELLSQQEVETVLIGSTRFDALLKLPATFELRKKNKILCCLFLDSKEALYLAYKAIEISKQVDCDLSINYHPQLCNETIVVIKSMIINQSHVTLSESPAKELLEDVFLVIYNSSSVCFEAALRGIPILYIKCENLPNLDRFYNQSESILSISEGVTFVKSLIENEDFYQKYSMKIYEMAKTILKPLNVNKLEEMIQ